MCGLFKKLFFLIEASQYPLWKWLILWFSDMWLEYFSFLAKPYRTLRSDGEGPGVTVSEGRVALVLSAWPGGLCSSEAHTM